MFDNSAALDGTTPRSWGLSLLFWIGMALLGVNGVHHALEAVIEPLYKSNWNWKLGWGRWIWLSMSTGSFICLSIILWWGCSWGFVITLQHFLLGFCLPLVVLYEAVSVGWIFGWDARVKHFGKTAMIAQVTWKAVHVNLYVHMYASVLP